MSFLQKLKGKGVKSDKDTLMSNTKDVATNKVAQLYVDVYQTENTTVIYAQSPGADMNDVHVSIEGEANIILIEGKRVRPEYKIFSKKVDEGSFVAEECVWGNFYRRIILPESVNIEEAEAKIKNGVLILVLPFLKPSKNEKVQLKVSGSREVPKRRS